MGYWYCRSHSDSVLVFCRAFALRRQAKIVLFLAYVFSNLFRRVNPAWLSCPRDGQAPALGGNGPTDCAAMGYLCWPYPS